MIYASANYELVSKYLRDKNPYAEQDTTVIQPGNPFMPHFLS